MTKKDFVSTIKALYPERIDESIDIAEKAFKMGAISVLTDIKESGWIDPMVENKIIKDIFS